MATYNPGHGPYNNPQITISTPLQPPPQQLTSALPNPTIFGVIDGVNQIFWWQIYFPQYQVFRNGNQLTSTVDYAGGPLSLQFFGGAIPQPGDLITLQGFGTL